MPEKIDWAALNAARARIAASITSNTVRDDVHEAAGDVSYDLVTKARALVGGDPNMPEVWGDMQWWIDTALLALGIYPDGTPIQ